jgi:hypothetical protein
MTNEVRKTHEAVQHQGGSESFCISKVIKQKLSHMNRHLVAILLIISAISNSQLNAQTSTVDQLLGQTSVNTITTAVPFLLIAPDSRGGGLGDAGVATTPDVNSMHYNPSKYSFMENDMGYSVSYTPWLKNLIDDIHLLYLTGYYRFDKRQSVAASLRYFSLGNIIFTDIVGNTTGNFKPNEFSLDFAYSRLLAKNLSGSIALRWVHSNLTGGIYVEGTESHPGNAVASDIAFYYQKKNNWLNKDAMLGLGINISNIGSKISYTENAERDFLPANLKLGAAYTMDIDDYNQLMFTLDVNKLLVPTPPIYSDDPTQVDADGDPIIIAGMDPDVSVVTGMFQSFYDAPGVFQDGQLNIGLEEFREINYSVGLEYWYAKQFAIRGGYFFEHPTKGNREFFTLGLGLKLNVFSMDFSYLVSTYSTHPLANTLRFTLGFNLEDFRTATQKI